MTIYGWLISALWLTLVAYWGSSAGAVQRKIGGRWIWWREIAVRLGFFALVVSAVQVAVVGRALPNAPLYALNASLSMGLIGVLCCVLGIGLAILGRAYLERSRGVELVTEGPYALVRHPIYGGMLLAMLGSALGQSVFWSLPLIVYGPLFIRSARREEKLLSEQFPERYPAYEKRTKMLLPFLL
jgi:protein-S-isoprenylcysteine O-methyltransferase Ste14